MFKPVKKLSVTNSWLPNLLPMSNLTFSLSTLHQILNKSNMLKLHLQDVNWSLLQHKMVSTSVANKLVHLARKTETDTAHNWWDIFTGWSAKETKLLNWLIHPILIVMCVIIILTMWNCYLTYQMSKISKIKSNNSYV